MDEPQAALAEVAGAAAAAGRLIAGGVAGERAKDQGHAGGVREPTAEEVGPVVQEVAPVRVYRPLAIGPLVVVVNAAAAVGAVPGEDGTLEPKVAQVEDPPAEVCAIALEPGFRHNPLPMGEEGASLIGTVVENARVSK